MGEERVGEGGILNIKTLMAVVGNPTEVCVVEHREREREEKEKEKRRQHTTGVLVFFPSSYSRSRCPDQASCSHTKGTEHPCTVYTTVRNPFR